MGFVKNNQEFDCVNCGYHVLFHPVSSRDHCTRCLSSLHVDVTPGDRMNQCKGILVPIGLVMRDGKRQIKYRCQTCHAQVNNIVAPDDDTSAIIELSRFNY